MILCVLCVCVEKTFPKVSCETFCSTFLVFISGWWTQGRSRGAWDLWKDDYLQIGYKRDYGTEWRDQKLLHTERVSDKREQLDSALQYTFGKRVKRKVPSGRCEEVSRNTCEEKMSTLMVMCVCVCRSTCLCVR